jgi:hypothetical protein
MYLLPRLVLFLDMARCAWLGLGLGLGSGTWRAALGGGLGRGGAHAERMRTQALRAAASDPPILRSSEPPSRWPRLRKPAGMQGGVRVPPPPPLHRLLHLRRRGKGHPRFACGATISLAEDDAVVDADLQPG